MDGQEIEKKEAFKFPFYCKKKEFVHGETYAFTYFRFSDGAGVLEFSDYTTIIKHYSTPYVMNCKDELIDLLTNKMTYKGENEKFNLIEIEEEEFRIEYIKRCNILYQGNFKNEFWI